MVTPRDEAVVVFAPNPHGGRLVYYAATADAGYWDRVWDREETGTDYARYQAGHLPRFLRRTFLQYVPTGARVLEAGCGLAWFTVAADALGYEAEGVDYAPRVVARLQERFPDLTFFEGDVRNLEATPDASYDAVFSPGVCEHFESGPEAVLAETYRILRPGGIALVSTPCFNPARRLLAKLGRFRANPNGMAFYQYAFSPGEMTAILERIGFTVEATDLNSVMGTLDDHMPGMRRAPGQLRAMLGRVLEALPPVRAVAGHSCVWVARKP